MISTKKSLTQNTFLVGKQLNLDRTPKLVAVWKKVDGKLICQWIKT